MNLQKRLISFSFLLLSGTRALAGEQEALADLKSSVFFMNSGGKITCFDQQHQGPSDLPIFNLQVSRSGTGQLSYRASGKFNGVDSSVLVHSEHGVQEGLTLTLSNRPLRSSDPTILTILNIGSSFLTMWAADNGTAVNSISGTSQNVFCVLGEGRGAGE